MQTPLAALLLASSYFAQYVLSGCESGIVKIGFMGDWGRTDGSCKEINAQKAVAAIIAQEAAESPFDAFLLGGDNIYYTGVTKLDSKMRLDASFENVYNGDSIKNLPFYVTLGNHDFPGGSNICRDESRQSIDCADEDKLIEGLSEHKDAQMQYSAVNKRWNFPSFPYYKTHFDKDGVTVDVYMIDTNNAIIAGALSICCQCYYYTKNDPNGVCLKVTRESPFCFGGKKHLFDKCMDFFNQQTDKALIALEADACKSTAQHKFVFTHYSIVFHLNNSTKSRIFEIAKKCGISSFLSGHTHASAVHKYDETLYITSGAGGGYTAEVMDYDPQTGDTLWYNVDAEYGFLSIEISSTDVKYKFILLENNKDIQLPVDGEVVASQIKKCFQVVDSHKEPISCETN